MKIRNFLSITNIFLKSQKIESPLDFHIFFTSCIIDRIFESQRVIFVYKILTKTLSKLSISNQDIIISQNTKQTTLVKKNC